jgi:hypothetical protein
MGSSKRKFPAFRLHTSCPQTVVENTKSPVTYVPDPGDEMTLPLMPKIKSAKPIAHFNVATHTAVLYAEIEPAGRVQYAYLLTVFDPTKQIKLIISSEVNSMQPTMGGGSHYLCIFDDTGRSNLGDSNDWADEELFTARALGIVWQRLEHEEPPEQGGTNTASPPPG